MRSEGSDTCLKLASHRLRPCEGSWCIEALSTACPEQYDEIFQRLSVTETLFLLKALSPPLRLRVIRNLQLAPFIKSRIERGVMKNQDSVVMTE